MTADRLEVRVGLSVEGVDADALAESAANLSDELADCDVDDVTTVAAGDTPPGAKGVELLAIGALVVKLARSRDVLMQVVNTVRDWLTRNEADGVRVEIDGDVLELKSASESERKALIDAWVQRHSET